MNDKIKELAAKSNFGHLENDEVVYDHRLETFSILLIKECIEINKQELSFNAFEKLLNRYQEQFGIK